jgi:dTDP-4-amino-4,6-dideoxygalactose transaminase
MVGEIWESGQLTNYGEKSQLLEQRLQEHLGVKHLILASNGTVAIQLAIKALGLSGKIITTPFSYVATVSSIVWEGYQPVFADIDGSSFCLDPDKVEELIDKDTAAILATHVYGIPCDVKRLKQISEKHNIPVIYDAAHAFDVSIEGTSVLNFGDISTLSFHATKIFQTGEGGAIVTNDDQLAAKLRYLGNFGHETQETFNGIGINAKMSEFHAAMGLCVLPHIGTIISKRKLASETYDRLLENVSELTLLKVSEDISHNYSYYPVVFKDETTCINVRDAMNTRNIFPRRYFYPSLNHLPYLEYQSCPEAESISERILCLPLSAAISADEINEVCSVLLNSLDSLKT